MDSATRIKNDWCGKGWCETRQSLEGEIAQLTAERDHAQRMHDGAHKLANMYQAERDEARREVERMRLPKEMLDLARWIYNDCRNAGTPGWRLAKAVVAALAAAESEVAG